MITAYYILFPHNLHYRWNLPGSSQVHQQLIVRLVRFPNLKMLLDKQAQKSWCWKRQTTHKGVIPPHLGEVLKCFKVYVSYWKQQVGFIINELIFGKPFQHHHHMNQTFQPLEAAKPFHHLLELQASKLEQS